MRIISVISALAAMALAQEIVERATSSAQAANTDSSLPKLSSGAPTTSSSTTPTSAAALPGLSTSTGLPKLPTLTSAGQTSYSYPPPTVPPTADAPFMQTSNLPEGTVFIAVGAILGAFGAAVLIWRAVVAWLLHRSVKRAALAQHLANDKAGFLPPPAATTASATMYKFKDAESSVSLGNPVAGRGVRRTARGPIPSTTPSETNLFFSPTARGNAANAGNRSSQFLPSGFYAAGSGAPAQNHNHSISLTDLRPSSRDFNRQVKPSPPESPAINPHIDHSRRNMSTSSLNLNRPPSGRAPSAFLDDLLDENHGQLPPPNTQHWR